MADVPNIGKVEGGFLGILTKGRVSRMEYTKQALRMAMIPYENAKMFAAPAKSPDPRKTPARKPDPRKTCGACNHERSGCQLHDSVEWMREYWGDECPHCVKKLPEGLASCDCGFYLSDLSN